MQHDELEPSEGVNELKGTGKRVAKGLGRTIKSGAINTYETGVELMDKDYDHAKQGH